MKLAPIIAKLKYRFDLGQSFLSIGTFVMAVIAASGKLSELFHVSAKAAVFIFVPIAMIGAVLFGCVLLRMKFAEAYNRECNERNDMMKKAAGEQ